MDEVKGLLSSKGNETRILESFKQMSKKLLDKSAVNSDRIDIGSIRRRFAQVRQRGRIMIAFKCSFLY